MITNKCRCNNCYGIFEEDIKECPKCKTDAYLMQPYEENNIEIKTPWYRGLTVNGEIPIFGHDENKNAGMPVFVLDKYSKNADIDSMIKMVNCHDDLVYALKRAIAVMNNHLIDDDCDCCKQDIVTIKQAVLKAEDISS